MTPRRVTGLMLMALAMALAMPGPAGRAHAQTPPSPAQIAAYDGLHKAAWEGDAAAVRRLLAGGADPNARDGDGRTPLHVAAFASHDGIVRQLVEGGADPTFLERDRYDIITIAAVADDPDLVALAIELGGDAAATTSRYDGTALIAAAHLGHDQVVRALIAAVAPLDHVNNLGWTALIEAVILGDGGARHVNVVRDLLAAGADRSIADRQGRTALDHARARGYSDMAGLLAAN